MSSVCSPFLGRVVSAQRISPFALICANSAAVSCEESAGETKMLARQAIFAREKRGSCRVGKTSESASLRVIQHIGTPKNIYQRPANLFVATFIGRSNILKGRLEADGERCELVFQNGYRVEMNNVLPEERHAQDVLISVRPEEFLLDETGARKDGLKVTINDSIFLGLNTHYFMTDENGERIETIQESSIGSTPEKHSSAYLGVNTAKINVFTADGSRNILKGVQNDLDSQEE